MVHNALSSLTPPGRVMLNSVRIRCGVPPTYDVSLSRPVSSVHRIPRPGCRNRRRLPSYRPILASPHSSSGGGGGKGQLSLWEPFNRPRSAKIGETAAAVAVAAKPPLRRTGRWRGSLACTIELDAQAGLCSLVNTRSSSSLTNNRCKGTRPTTADTSCGTHMCQHLSMLCNDMLS